MVKWSSRSDSAILILARYLRPRWDDGRWRDAVRDKWWLQSADGETVLTHNGKIGFPQDPPPPPGGQSQGQPWGLSCCSVEVELLLWPVTDGRWRLGSSSLGKVLLSAPASLTILGNSSPLPGHYLHAHCPPLTTIYMPTNLLFMLSFYTQGGP